jgi:hypothetical protein
MKCLPLLFHWGMTFAINADKEAGTVALRGFYRHLASKNQ